ncbi:MAG: DUF4906 domain-containing protein [Dysgonomonas sp.]|nr:DUF4906 domain-containing protein [Dysgonomonas sp.]
MQKKKLTYLIIYITILFSAISCAQDEYPVPEDVMAIVKIDIQPEDMKSSLCTKSLTTEQENTIYNYHILVYNSDGELKSKGYSTSSAKLTLKVPIGNSINEVTINDCLVMSGSLTGVNITTANYTLTGLKVSRIAAKITLKITTEYNIKITGYRIMQMPKKSYLISRPNTKEKEPDDLAVGDDAAPTETFNTTTIPLNNLASYSISFYMYENRRGRRKTVSGGTGTVTDQKQKAMYAPDNATYVEIYAFGSGFRATYKVYLGADNCQNYNVKRNGQYIYNITLKSETENDTRVTINESLPAQPLSNSYIVDRGKTIYIPIFRANQSSLGTQITDVTSNQWTVQVLWQTVQNLVTVSVPTNARSLGCFEVKTTSSNVSGNAIVVLKNTSNNQILWSWHIWVTNYNPNSTNAGSTNGGYNVTGGKIYRYNNGMRNTVFMDRNLGAINATVGNAGALGLFYQWGRKDPFPATVGTTGDNSTIQITIYNGSIVYQSGQASLKTATQNPNTFYNSNQRQWCTDGNDNMWDKTGRNKSVLDPCPPGWRVPMSSTWTGITALNYATGAGPNWNLIGYFPANGNIEGTVKGYVYIGLHGHYWIAETDTLGRGGYFTVTPTMAYEYLYSANTHGIGIRCVKE